MKADITNKRPMEIVIDDGTEEVPVKNKKGDVIGIMKFRPTDIGQVSRYNEMADKIEDVLAPLENIGINPDGTPMSDDEEDWETMESVKKQIFDIFDYIYDGNMSEAFFSKMHPFSPVKGNFFCMSAFDLVGKYISAAFDSEVKQINKKVDKYTRGYRTGKHKNGGKKGSR